ncbi:MULTISPECIES: 50S ribosomal protein L24 [unclassified Lacihabitans]|jgi:large subunit ribosomal protein L24|uniref:50S ribosomal protein L24 n=1 Tax=unclassified Lacihabitans TaxID=2638817 RepID=UPI000BD012FA|nr:MULTISPECIES: 50S ribosomal protein L24 [unclassified Lacihabitans]MBP6619130.1 50S ribosomal protein L24 [Leadbetterella sp.]OYU64628.1 MAG: 50S ribosomal protein L24 [Cytophagaceae bacterium BCCC1]MCP9746305.1 50S ribosomal protein L24 [Lacihabitans sp. CS3-21]MCP9755848.1 50S ribosomal protein L24 [Lacihabitans sp. CCS-44]MDP1818201.1 50S ribosomal protein L24 [Leadbetterella sp.]
MERKFNKQPKLHVKTGDTVEVIAGNSKGKRGKIVEVLVKKNRVVVEGVNLIKKHIKPNAQSPQGEIKELEGTIHISNVLVVDPSTGKPTRVGRKLNDAGNLQRFSKASGKFI